MLFLLGNQLFPSAHLPPPSDGPVFMSEDKSLFSHGQNHQQKLVLYLAAMRAYADELRSSGYDVHYQAMRTAGECAFQEGLSRAMKESGESTVRYFEIEDKPVETRVSRVITGAGYQCDEMRSPMFMWSRDEFSAYANGKTRLLMGDFYTEQRRRHGILIDEDGNPTGGRWSFDEDNRKKLPKTVEPPEIAWPEPDRHVGDVIELVEWRWADYPGKARDFRWPTTRRQALDWLDRFIDERMAQFGPYEDAMSTRSDTVFHSLLTPSMNIGLLTPAEIVDKVIERADDAPIQSVEGFVRQVIGWREFIRGIYREQGDNQMHANFWSHKRELAPSWYDGTTGIPPLDDTIRTAKKLGWAHHIPRLMVMANLMTLSEIRPTTGYQWFMDMFVDSAEWVMVPNVFGMGLFSDGGIFATKPYICGSNYLLKMSDWRKGPWCDTVDGLYWRFIDKHREFFAGNPRLAPMPRALDRLSDERRSRIFAAAETFLAEHTTSS